MKNEDLNKLLEIELKAMEEESNLIPVVLDKNLGFAEQSKLIQSKKFNELKVKNENLKIKEGDELLLERKFGNILNINDNFRFFEIRYLLNDIQVFNFDLLFSYESNLKSLNKNLPNIVSGLKNKKIMKKLHDLILEDLIFLHDEKQKFKNEEDFFDFFDFFDIDEVVLNL